MTIGQTYLKINLLCGSFAAERFLNGIINNTTGCEIETAYIERLDDGYCLAVVFADTGEIIFFPFV